MQGLNLTSFFFFFDPVFRLHPQYPPGFHLHVPVISFPVILISALTSCSHHPDATVYVGGLDEKVSEPLLWELFLQAGPVVNTHMPKDRVTGQHQGEYVARGAFM